MDVDALADELYGLPPERFIDARNARVKELRAKGERQRAEVISKLAKPSPPAWLANLLVRTRPRVIDELLGIGDDLRSAQQRGAGDDTRRLSVRRQELIRQLVEAAAEETGATGHSIGGSHQRQLEETLEAAVADPSAASDLRAGRLTQAMAHVGFGEVAAVRRSRPPPARSRPQAGLDGPAGRERDRRGEQRRRARDKAGATLVEARADLTAAERTVGEARGRRDAAAASRRQAAKALKEAEREARESALELGRAEQKRQRARDALKKAERELRRRA